jgi:hypothetical protein
LNQRADFEGWGRGGAAVRGQGCGRSGVWWGEVVWRGHHAHVMTLTFIPTHPLVSHHILLYSTPPQVLSLFLALRLVAHVIVGGARVHQDLCHHLRLPSAHRAERVDW